MGTPIKQYAKHPIATLKYGLIIFPTAGILYHGLVPVIARSNDVAYAKHYRLAKRSIHSALKILEKNLTIIDPERAKIELEDLEKKIKKYWA